MYKIRLFCTYYVLKRFSSMAAFRRVASPCLIGISIATVVRHLAAYYGNELACIIMLGRHTAGQHFLQR